MIIVVKRSKKQKKSPTIWIRRKGNDYRSPGKREGENMGKGGESSPNREKSPKDRLGGDRKVLLGGQGED